MTKVDPELLWQRYIKNHPHDVSVWMRYLQNPTKEGLTGMLRNMFYCGVRAREHFENNSNDNLGNLME